MHFVIYSSYTASRLGITSSSLITKLQLIFLVCLVVGSVHKRCNQIFKPKFVPQTISGLKATGQEEMCTGKEGQRR